MVTFTFMKFYVCDDKKMRRQMFLYNFIEIFTVFYYSDYKSTVMNKVK